MLRRLLPAVFALLAAAPAAAITYQFSTPIAGDTVPVTLALTDVAGGVQVTVSIAPGAGDLLGVFGSTANEAGLSGMAVTSGSGVVTQWQFGPANAVWKVGGGNVMSPVKTFDWGLKLGATGSGGGVVETATFTLTGVSVAQLTGASTQGWVFGVRIQGTGGPEGSAKIAMPVGTPPVEDSPTIAITSPEDGALVGSQVAVAGTVSGTSPTVTVNGQAATVSGGTWSTALTLADGTHTLTATATNAAGSASDSVTVTVDTMGPLVAITAPADGSVTNETPVVVSGTVTDATPVASVLIHGTSFLVTGGTFTGTAALVEGANTVTVSAVDAAGNPGQASVSVGLDTTPPAVVISTPPDGTLTTQAAILVEGSVSDAGTIASFTVNGQAVTLGAGGAFSTSVALAPGANPITATATDAAGNTGTASVDVTRGSVPTVAIATPAAGFLMNQASALATGTATNAASVSVNGVAAILSGNDWTATVPLAEGANTLTATATNAFGSAQASVSGTRDSTQPLVTITSPANGSETSEATVIVVGTAIDASPIVGLTIDGEPITPGASFDVSTALSEGPNTITVTATDAAGNVGSASVTVSRRSVEPLAVVIASPPDGSLVSQPRIAVAGTVSPAGAAVAVNGVQATVTGESWTAAAVPLDEGPNTLTATATRESATASDSTGVTLNLPPEISITSPLDGAVLREATIDVEGFVSDALALVDVNGVTARIDSGGRFVAEDVTLDAGPNDLLARAIDLQGAQASDRAAVTRDDAAGPTLRAVVGFAYNFNPYPDDPFFFLDAPDTRFVTFSSTDEWLAAMAEIGRAASGFLPAADLPVVRGAADSVLLFVLTEEPDEPSIEFVFPDGHPSDYIESDYQGSGPAEAVLDQPFFSFFPQLQLVSPEALTPSDFGARYYHTFTLTRPVSQGDDDVPPPHSAPLLIRAVQGEGSDSILVFWDEEEVVTELATPGPDSHVSGASIAASGPAADNHTLAAVTHRVLHFGFGATAIDLGRGEGSLSDGRFRVTDAPLGLGNNRLHVNVHDATSWSSLLEENVLRDPSTPDVQLVNPRDGQALIEETASLSLSFGTPLTLVSVNGEPDGRAFSGGVVEDALTLPLALGPNPLQLEVDAGSGSLFFSFVLYRVATLDPPRITSPAHRSLVNTDTMQVEGVVPLGTPYVEVNGVPGTIEAGGVRFTATIPVPRDLGVLAVDGDAVPKPLVVTAVAYPQSTSASIEVTPDFLAPAFRIVLPEDGAATLEEVVAYGGWLSEPATVTLTHAGGEQVLATVRDRAREGQVAFNLFNVFQFHRFEFEPVPVSAGTNTVTLSARDRAGNTSSLTLDVERFAAALALTSPTAPVPALATDLVFDVIAPVTLQGMFVNGRFLPSTRQLSLPAGTATLANVPLEPGTNALRLVYSQAGGPQQVLNLAVESTSTAASVITGTVLDPQSGQGIWGALVALEVNGHTILVATAPDGTFRIVVAPGHVMGSVTALGYAGASFDLTVAGGETVNTSVSLAPVGPGGAPPRPEEVQLLATVRDASTLAPIQGVTVEALGEGEGAIRTTDGAGLAELSAIRVGEQSLRFRHRGFIDTFLTTQIVAPGTGNVVARTFDLDLAAGEHGTIAVPTEAPGSVLNGMTLRPVAPARIEARDVLTQQVIATTFTDPQGTFVLAALPPLRTVDVTVTGAGHEQQTIRVLVVPRGDERIDFRVHVLAEGKVVGTITDAVTGAPVDLCQVSLPGTPLATATKRDGTFTLYGAPPGSYDLEVQHPMYFPATMPGVVVSGGEDTTASRVLTARPAIGSIFGVVRRTPSGLPVAGATLTGPAGIATVSDADGRYTLAGLPTGLVEVTLSAPDHPTVTKTATVRAGEERYAEFDFSNAPVEATAAIPITGGSLVLPDGSVRVDFPPLALSKDAIVTLRRRVPPEVSVGEPLAMEPALGLTGIVALGSEFVIRVESATPGTPAPVFIGSIVISGSYSAAHEAALGATEEGVVPLYYDPDQAHWTLPRVVPHLHAHDRLNRVIVSALSMVLTQTGGPITARLTTREPILLAGFAGLPTLNEVREFVFDLAKQVAPAVPVPIPSGTTHHALTPDELSEGPRGALGERNAWDKNARPVLVFHGWNPLNLFVNNLPDSRGELVENPYGNMIYDLMTGTDGVYRTVYFSYNTRLGLDAIAGLVEGEVRAAEGDALRSHPADPFDPSTGSLFPSYDSLGFSMGGLIERAHQGRVRSSGGLRPIKGMIAMATPHHGALQVVRGLVQAGAGASLGFFGVPGIEALFRLWSPGTADLLDYSDTVCEQLGPALSGNPTLCNLNRNPRTAPDRKLSLIAGTDGNQVFDLYDEIGSVTDSDGFLDALRQLAEAAADDIETLASEGFLATGCTQSDGVVCVWSAHARTGKGASAPSVIAFRNVDLQRSERTFTHHNAGTEDQPIRDFMNQDILPILTDWVVGHMPEAPEYDRPTGETDGEYRARIEVEYNVPNEDITELAAVLYAGYEQSGQVTWRVLAGADEAGEPEAPLSVSGNSEGGDAETLVITAPIPHEEEEPDVFIPVLVPLGPSQETVPLEPDNEFQLRVGD